MKMQPCPDCNGTGRGDELSCYWCEGTGTIPAEDDSIQEPDSAAEHRNASAPDPPQSAIASPQLP